MSNRNLQPGQAFPFSAGFWNPILQAATDFKNSQSPQPSGVAGLLPAQHAVEILIRNESSSTVNRNGILRISGIAITPTASEARFRDRPIFIGQAPDGASTHGIVVTLEPIKQNAIGRAIIVGLSVAQVNVTSASHKFAKPINTNTTNFVSDAAEGFPLIWGVHTGTQPSWCAILLGSGPGGGQTTMVIARATADVTGNSQTFAAKIKATICGTPQTFDADITVENLAPGDYVTPTIAGNYLPTTTDNVFLLLAGMNFIAVKANTDNTSWPASGAHKTGWFIVQAPGTYADCIATEEPPPP